MKIAKQLAMAFYAIIMMLGMSSCKDDPYIDIISVTSCSPDLLLFVTPTVTITGDNGQVKTMTLSSSDFKESEKGGSITVNVTVNGEPSAISSTTVNNIAEVTERFMGESASGEIKVSYKLNSDIKLDKENYVFFHGVGNDAKIVDGSGLEFSTSGNYFKPIARQIKKTEVEEYLNLLTATPDKIVFSEKFSH